MTIQNSIRNIVFIGAGNVATHLAVALNKKGFKIIQVYSHSKKSASILASRVKASPTADLSEISKIADLYIISVSDNALTEISSRIFLKDKLVVHTSGSHDISILKGISSRYGVFYPLQTFSKSRNPDFTKIPVCIEAKKKEDEKILMHIAMKLSNDVRVINSASRRIIHIAAVFACNFTNFMYSSADKILLEKKIPFDILKPLIIETAKKIISEKPSEVQTGPARRGDLKIMEKHLKMIDDKDLRELYKIISKQIYKTYNK
jgi:predicted short-subunit dehydrogenase-like oxidoreductase (DUF2520 family)